MQIKSKMLYNLIIKLKPYQLINIVILFLVKKAKGKRGANFFKLKNRIKIKINNNIRELRK